MRVTKQARIVVACALLFLMALKFFLRVWHLKSTPPGLLLNDAAHGEDVKSAWRGEFRVSFPRVLGHEPLCN